MSIEEHEFSDGSNILHVDTNEDLIVFTCLWTQSGFNKKDVIAMAKHFKLTIDDLEG